MTPSSINTWNHCISEESQKKFEAQAFYWQAAKNIIKVITIIGIATILYLSFPLSFYPQLLSRACCILSVAILKSVCAKHINPQEQKALFKAERIERIRLKYLANCREDPSSLLTKEIELSNLPSFFEQQEEILKHPFLIPSLVLIQESRAEIEQAPTEESSLRPSIFHALLWQSLLHPGNDPQKHLEAAHLMV